LLAVTYVAHNTENTLLCFRGNACDTYTATCMATEQRDRIKALIIQPNTTTQIWYESFIIHYNMFRLSDQSPSGRCRIHKNNIKRWRPLQWYEL